MQLEDADIRPGLHEDIVAAWDVEELRPDRQRVMNSAGQLNKARVDLQSGVSVPVSGAAASREALLPHTYRITGTFPYPDGGTVNEAQVARWNALVALLTAEYPFYRGRRYEEEIGWEFEDDSEEQTYDVTVIFTIHVISRVQTV